MFDEKVKIEKCDLKNLDELIEIGKVTYLDTFQGSCSDDVIKKYLEEAFERNKIREEIMNKDSEFFFIYVDNEVSGYLKLNINSAQSDLKSENGLEIERLYIKYQYKSIGLGKLLIRYGLKRAEKLRKGFVWLGVWEKNSAAIGFYMKNGFSEIGVHDFIMGDEVQNDLIMRKDVIY